MSKVLLVTEFRPRDSQMPEDMPALIKLLGDELLTALRNTAGVRSADVWATMSATLSVHIEFESPEAAMAQAKNPNPDVLAALAAVARRAIVVRRESYSTLPIDMAKHFMVQL
jgi:hypothetical protein